jgi:hypothetical protein
MKLLRSIPYLVAACAAGILFYIAKNLSGNPKDLVLNLCADFLAIPVLLLAYESVKTWTHRKLNRQIYDYAKMQVDKEALGIINYAIKLVYPNKKPGLEILASQFGLYPF